MNNEKTVSLYLRTEGEYDLEPISFDDIRGYGLLDEFNRIIDSLGDSIEEIDFILELCPDRLSDGIPTFLEIVRRSGMSLEIREHKVKNPSSLVERCLEVCPKDGKLLILPAELKERAVKYMTKEEQIRVFSEYKCQYDNGQPKKHYYYFKNDNNKKLGAKGWRREGEGKSWYKNGNLMEQCFYKNGKKEGEYTFWNEDGVLARRCYYEKGNMSGECTEWYEDGALKIRSWYKKSRLEGEYKHWHKNGQLDEHCHFKKGKLDGKFKSWYKYGNIRMRCYYKGGKDNGKYESWHENGCIKKKCCYVMGKLEGGYKEWNERGKLTKNRCYSGGKVI